MPKPYFHALIPCRAGSARVIHKNSRPFGGREGGLIELKLEQLKAARLIDEVTVSTDDPLVKAIAEKARENSALKINIVDRPAELAIADSLDAFVAYIPTIIPEGVVMWMHVTSPFFRGSAIDRAIEAYGRNVAGGNYDSLMGVSRLQTFLWDQKKCISHDRDVVKWPQTQDLPPFFEVNSTVFMIEVALMRTLKDRIGTSPYLFETNKIESFDIDWEDDFGLGDMMLKTGMIQNDG